MKSADVLVKIGDESEPQKENWSSIPDEIETQEELDEYCKSVIEEFNRVEKNSLGDKAIAREFVSCIFAEEDDEDDDFDDEDDDEDYEDDDEDDDEEDDDDPEDYV